MECSRNGQDGGQLRGRRLLFMVLVAVQES